MTFNNKILVYIQTCGENINPISQKVITTAEVLANESDRDAIGVIFTSHLTKGLIDKLYNTNLTKVIIYKNELFSTFIPENEVCILSKHAKQSDVFLVPSTPEGRMVSSMTAAKLKTGCTADCTELDFNEEGFLIQTRPAFSGNVMASIITKNSLPQIASLKVAKKGTIKRNKPNIIVFEEVENIVIHDEIPTISSKIDEIQEDFVNTALVIGNAINSKEDLKRCRNFASNIGAKLFTTRALVDKGISDKSMQIGLSGNSIKCKTLLTLGVSGSIQFMAGIEKVDKIIAVNTDKNAPIMLVADFPIVMDVHDIIKEL